ncbi:MAG: EamA family transporter [Bacteroidales bacterium]|nr:EamA family transporter [Bacteroidales bacterium]
MPQLILGVLAQSILLTLTQFFLKLGVKNIGHIEWSWEYWKTIFLNWQISLSGICGIGALAIWVTLLKKHDFSLVYPLTAISYILGVAIAYFFLHESVPLTRWIGVIIIMIGVYFIVK